MAESFIVYVIKIIFLGSFFFACSISLTFYNKWLMKSFKFPLFVTFIHFLAQFVGAAIVRLLGRCFCRSWQPVLLPWGTYIKRVYPAGFAAAIDIGLSNMSLMYITVSLYVMSKTTSVIFVLLFGILFRLESPRVSTLLVVLLVSSGLFMFTYKATQFNLGGFILVMLASLTSGVRWVLLQMITQKDEIGLSNPVDTTYHMAPVMALGLLFPALYREGMPASLSKEIFYFSSFVTLESTLGKVGLGAVLAFLLTLSEYMFVHNTSSLTLSVTGILKELLTLFLAAEINGDKMSYLNMFGAGMCILGIACHVIFKASYAKVKHDVMAGDYRNEISLKHLKRLRDGLEGAELLNPENQDDESTSEDETVFFSPDAASKPLSR